MVPSVFLRLEMVSWAEQKFWVLTVDTKLFPNSIVYQRQLTVQIGLRKILIVGELIHQLGPTNASFVF